MVSVAAGSGTGAGGGGGATGTGVTGKLSCCGEICCTLLPPFIERVPYSSSEEAVTFGSSCVRKVISAIIGALTAIVGILSMSTPDDDEFAVWKTSSCSPMPI